MLKLVRLALTAAIVTAIVVRLRRRARMPEKEPAPPPPPRTSWGGPMGLVWAAIAAVVAVVLAVAVIPTESQEAGAAQYRAYQAEQDALTAELRAQESAQAMAVPTGPVATAVPTGFGGTPAPTGESTPTPAAGPTGACTRTGQVTERPISPRVQAAVDRQWRRIERWLRANAPRTHTTLARPARARTIAIAEAQMGLSFPDDLRASLLRHNGVSGQGRFTVAGAELWDIRRIRDEWRAGCARDGGPGRIIPFGDTMEADPDGGVRGAPFAGGDQGTVGPRSYHAMLRDVADGLERGGPVYGRRPAVQNGSLEWVKAP
ncbi:SMI1/KNR4 family protein [Nonomuraea purpurea]|uniref:SMI1/KNR4 family protein n=1 Tax=Nonomuraea purpurea TaxID=1849276 RepID=A0ABV8G226_9ACTN